jgi:hypothetical protein
MFILLKINKISISPYTSLMQFSFNLFKNSSLVVSLFVYVILSQIYLVLEERPIIYIYIIISCTSLAIKTIESIANLESKPLDSLFYKIKIPFFFYLISFKFEESYISHFFSFIDLIKVI